MTGKKVAGKTRYRCSGCKKPFRYNVGDRGTREELVQLSDGKKATIFVLWVKCPKCGGKIYL